MSGELSASNQYFIAGFPVDPSGNGGEPSARSRGDGNLGGTASDHERDFFADAVRKIEVGAIGQSVRMHLPFESGLCFARGSKRHRSLKCRVQISHTLEIAKIGLIIC